MELKALTYVEIDLPYCQNVYGSAPCTAAGTSKCFNTRNNISDCQDTANFSPGILTLRFGKDTGYLPQDIPCIPNLINASSTNAVVKPGKNIGERASFTASFKNHRHGDAGIDKYISDRPYDPFDKGTFWGKFRARNPYIENAPVRLIRGYLGQSLAQMETEHFVLSGFSGPNSSGTASIKGVDFMRLISGELAQAPPVSLGYIPFDLPSGSTSVTLEPVGVGASYPVSGLASMGEEAINYTRSGDTFTFGATTEDHDAEEVFQVALSYVQQTANNIIYDLIVNNSPLDASYTEPSVWQSLTDSFTNVLYSADIFKPTPVVDLVNELIEQAGLIVYGNNKRQKIEYDIMRPQVPVGRLFDESNIIKGSFSQSDNHKSRATQVWVFYNQKDPFKNVDEKGNYYSGTVHVVEENLHLTEAIKKIYSRWVPASARSVSSDIGARAIARYGRPPSDFRFSIFATTESEKLPSLGKVYRISSREMESCDGSPVEKKIIVTGISSSESGQSVQAEEFNISGLDYSLDISIQIDVDKLNLNLRSYYDEIYNTVETVNDIIFIIRDGVKIGASDRLSYAIETGSWPAGVAPIVRNYGYIVGRGGIGYAPPNELVASRHVGGPAVLATSAIRIDNQGIIGGGGGGGYGYASDQKYYGGGGGAGHAIGQGASASNGNGSDGTLLFGGTGGGGSAAHSGGNLGQQGGNLGGASGNAIEGESLVTYINVGDIRGNRVG